MHGHAHLTDWERWTLGRGVSRTGGTRACGNDHGDRGCSNYRFRAHPWRLPAALPRKRVIHEPSMQRTRAPTAGMKPIIHQTSTTELRAAADSAEVPCATPT